MTIHSNHPFATPEPDRDPVRRLRGRLGGAVGLLTTGSGSSRAGLTISSFLIGAGEPGHVVALIDPDSDLARDIAGTGAAVLQLLSWRHRRLADAFAGQFPAPGGVFRMGTWDDTAWGPRLRDATTWAGLRLADRHLRPVGWSLLVDTVIEELEVGDDPEPLVHRRGRYQRPDAASPDEG